MGFAVKRKGRIGAGNLEIKQDHLNTGGCTGGPSSFVG